MPRRPLSSCRQFRRLHVEYVDGLLSNEALRACRAHLDVCPTCAQQDVRIRRSLLALQALPTIEVSDGFHDRLCERLSREMMDDAREKSPWARRLTAGAIVAAVAVLYATAVHTRTPVPLRLTPVVARAPEPPSEEAAPSARAVTTVPWAPRFEALPGRSSLRPILQAPHLQSVRLQTVNYLGQ